MHVQLLLRVQGLQPEQACGRGRHYGAPQVCRQPVRAHHAPLVLPLYPDDDISGGRLLGRVRRPAQQRSYHPAQHHRLWSLALWLQPGRQPLHQGPAACCQLAPPCRPVRLRHGRRGPGARRVHRPSAAGDVRSRPRRSLPLLSHGYSLSSRARQGGGAEGVEEGQEGEQDTFRSLCSLPLPPLVQGPAALPSLLLRQSCSLVEPSPQHAQVPQGRRRRGGEGSSSCPS
mmetsp:Transcript_40371/g.127039  ORF Transcript_40371/g.127039 Transcript_40371/m.127039 type:complete len:229 (+) Transcript_40371:885-1571(+)